MWPGYQMSGGRQLGSARGSVASGRRRGGGRPAMAKRTRILPLKRGVISSRIAASCESARETKLSTATAVRRVPSTQS